CSLPFRGSPARAAALRQRSLRRARRALPRHLRGSTSRCDDDPSEPVHDRPEDLHALAEPALEEKHEILAELDETTDERVPRLHRRLDHDELEVGAGNVPGDLLLDALIHRADPDRRACGRTDYAMKAHSAREDLRD